MAKYNLGKVRIKQVQLAVSPFTVHDLRGGPLETCRAIVSCCIAHALLRTDHCGSFEVYFNESLWILALNFASFVNVMNTPNTRVKPGGCDHGQTKSPNLSL